jgi:nicotinate-nucleotide pyrophosphorylase (carboxylating)
MNFTATESAACSQLVDLALKEDLATVGDVTSRSLIPPGQTGRAAVVARSAGVLAGLPAAILVARAVDAKLELETHRSDGDLLYPDTELGVLCGPIGSVLTAERTVLNFLQHLSGVATRTRQFVSAVAGLRCQILDTRKTLPGWRLLEKYAVRCGGGYNHRLGLYDGFLIKDNHLAAVRAGTPIAQAIRRCRENPQHGSLPIEVEVDTLTQLDEALAGGADLILLDNMTLDQLRDAVGRRDRTAPGVLLEASGGVTLDTVRAIAETGVDRISVGALTHSAPALDIALDYRDA